MTITDIGSAYALRGYDVRFCADRFLVYSSAIKNLKIKDTFAVTCPYPNGGNSTFTANAGTNVLTSSGHGIQENELVNFTTDDTLPGGIGSWDDGFFYYAVNVTANTFQIAETPSGTPIDITSAGSGTHDWWTDTNKVLIVHNMGYYSPWLINYTGSTGEDGRDIVNFMSDGTFYLDIRIFEDFVEIYVDPQFGNQGDYSPGDTLYFTCYQGRDEFVDYTAPTTATGTDVGSGGDVGSAFAKDGFDVRDCEDKDLIYSTSYFSALIHKMGVVDADEADEAGEVEISHSLGYVPAFLPFRKPNGKSYLEIANDAVSVNTTRILYTFVSVVLEEPSPDEQLYFVIFMNRSV